MADGPHPTPLLDDGTWTEVTRWMESKLIGLPAGEYDSGWNDALRECITRLAVEKSRELVNRATQISP